MNDDKKDKLPEWDKTQIEAQKKINKRMTARTAGALIAVLAIIIIAIIVTFASCDRNSTPQKPNSDASTSAIQKYSQDKFSDNNASSIDTVSQSPKTKVLIVKVDNVDVSSDSSASNSFGQLTDELQSIGTFDAAKKGVIFYGIVTYTDAQGKQVDETSFALYFKQDSISSLNSGYSDYISSGNYESLFKNSDAYYLYGPFKESNRALNKLPNNDSQNIIEKSLDLTVQ